MEKSLKSYQKKLTDKEITEIIELYQTGHNTSFISNQFKVCNGTVLKYLKLNNVPLIRCRKGARKLNSDQEREIVELYKQGRSSTQLGEMFQVNKTTIVKYLKKNQVVTNSTKSSLNKNKVKLMTKEIIELYQSGLSTNKIAKQLEFSTESIIRNLEKNNIPLRHGKFVAKLSLDQQEEAAKVYLSGKSSYKVAKEFNVPRDVIKRVLRKRNIKPRTNKNNFKFTQQHIDKMLELYKKGMDTLKISKLFNCHYTTIKRYMTKAGIETRYGRNGKTIRKDLKIKEFPGNKNFREHYKVVYKNLDTVISAPENVYRLDLSGQDLYDLPMEITKCYNLRHLNLNNNYLDCLPIEINKLFKLNFLDLSDNNFTELPLELFQLSRLETLNLSQNFFTEIPDNLRFLFRLKYFDASFNKLSVFAAALLKLKSLERLELEGNSISRLPNEISSLINLQTLNLAENKLTILPTNLSSLVKLKSLNISKNKIAVLPKALNIFSDGK